MNELNKSMRAVAPMEMIEEMGDVSIWGGDEWWAMTSLDHIQTSGHGTSPEAAVRELYEKWKAKQ